MADKPLHFISTNSDDSKRNTGNPYASAVSGLGSEITELDTTTPPTGALANPASSGELGNAKSPAIEADALAVIAALVVTEPRTVLHSAVWFALGAIV